MTETVKKRRQRRAVLTTPLEFEAARPLLKLSEENIESARLYLVEGKPTEEIAEARGCTSMHVWKCAKTVEKALAAYLESLKTAGLADAFLAQVEAQRAQQPRRKANKNKSANT